MNDLEQAIYESLINIVLKDFNDSEVEEIKEEYKNYLISVYRDLYNLDNDKEKLKKSFIRTEIMRWKGKSKNYKQRSLLKDEYFAKLVDISQMAYKYATYRKTGKVDQVDITKNQADKYIYLMNEYLEKVRDFNKTEAIQLLSEGSTDFYYALGLIEEKSFRLK